MIWAATLILVQEFINIPPGSTTGPPFNDQRKYWNGELPQQWLLQLIAGYRADSAAN